MKMRNYTVADNDSNFSKQGSQYFLLQLTV